MIAKIYGLFTIHTNYFDSVDIIVMQNTAQVLKKENKTYSFDLKGSLKGRWVKFNPKKYPEGKASPLLKDRNFLELNESRIDKQVVDIRETDI